MKDELYKNRCAKTNRACCGRIGDYCVSIENCRYKVERITNYERIKNMSIEELAKALCNSIPNMVCNIVCNGDCKAISTLNKSSEQICKDKCLEWLNSEVIN